MKIRLSASIAGCALLVTVEAAPAQSWVQLTNVPSAKNWSCALSADGTKLILGSAYNAPVLSSLDSGATWSTNNLPPADFWTAVASSADGSKLLAAAGYPPTGPLYRSTNAGATWTPCYYFGTYTITEMWTCLACSADGSVIAGGTADGWMLTSTNSGASWKTANALSTFYLSMAASADGTKLAAIGGVNYSNYVYLSTNSGASWFTSSAPILNWQAVASSADGSKLVVVGANPTLFGPNGIYTSTDSGMSWRSNYLAGLNGEGYWTCVASSADGTRLAAGSGYSFGIYISTNSGADWFNSGAPSGGWNGIAASADGDKFLAVGGNAYVWQAPCAPVLKGTGINGGLAISWTVPSVNFVLQQNNDLATSNWIAVTNTPVFDFSTLRQQVGVSMSNTRGFYRLKTRIEHEPLRITQCEW